MGIGILKTELWMFQFVLNRRMKIFRPRPFFDFLLFIEEMARNSCPGNQKFRESKPPLPQSIPPTRIPSNLRSSSNNSIFDLVKMKSASRQESRI